MSHSHSITQNSRETAAPTLSLRVQANWKDHKVALIGGVLAGTALIAAGIALAILAAPAAAAISAAGVGLIAYSLFSKNVRVLPLKPLPPAQRAPIVEVTELAQPKKTRIYKAPSDQTDTPKAKEGFAPLIRTPLVPVAASAKDEEKTAAAPVVTKDGFQKIDLPADEPTSIEDQGALNEQTCQLKQADERAARHAAAGRIPSRRLAGGIAVSVPVAVAAVLAARYALSNPTEARELLAQTGPMLRHAAAVVRAGAVAAANGVSRKLAQVAATPLRTSLAEMAAAAPLAGIAAGVAGVPRQIADAASSHPRAAIAAGAAVVGAGALAVPAVRKGAVAASHMVAGKATSAAKKAHALSFRRKVMIAAGIPAAALAVGGAVYAYRNPQNTKDLLNAGLAGTTKGGRSFLALGSRGFGYVKGAVTPRLSAVAAWASRSKPALQAATQAVVPPAVIEEVGNVLVGPSA